MRAHSSLRELECPTNTKIVVQTLSSASPDRLPVLLCAADVVVFGCGFASSLWSPSNGFDVCPGAQQKQRVSTT